MSDSIWNFPSSFLCCSPGFECKEPASIIDTRIDGAAYCPDHAAQGVEWNTQDLQAGA